MKGFSFQTADRVKAGNSHAFSGEVHAHVHVHADGTVHNHYHCHPGGGLNHSHAEDSPDHTHGEGSDCGLLADVQNVAHDHDVSDGIPPVHRHFACATGHVALRAQDLSYRYGKAGKEVFRDIGIQARAGEVLAILGNNGAGKSTLLNLLAGIGKPATGRVWVGDCDLSGMSRRVVARHVAYVAQQQRIPHLTVYDQVLLGRRPHVRWSLSDYDRNVVAHTIEQLGLSGFSSRYLDELSGGERQKVYIARALAQEPEVLLLDEPTSALDPRNQIEVLRVVREVTRAESIATVLVIHDINLALRFCDRFLLVRDGCVVAQGDRTAVTDQALTETYGIPFKVSNVAGVPVAIPLDVSPA